MRIGFLPHLDPSGGGSYHYGMTMIKALAELQRGGLADDFVLLEYDGAPAAEDGMIPPGWARFQLKENALPSRVLRAAQVLERASRRFLGNRAHEAIKRHLKWYVHRVSRPFRCAANREPSGDAYAIRPRPHLSRRLRECNVDVVLTTDAVPWFFEAGIPYVMAIHDLQHRLQPRFPEVSANGEWKRREYVFRNGASMATLVLVDSDTGKEDVLDCYGEYGITEDRVKVLPFLPTLPEPTLTPADAESILNGFEIAGPYLFYPAQLWPHKNHVRLVEAVGRLAQTHELHIDLVLTGGAPDDIRNGVLSEINEVAGRFGIQSQLRHLGHVSAAEMEALYVGARALVMPTFFGPTNIPPIEAWVFGCPVITSDIRGIREQMGDAALLVDPGEVESIADGIRRVWENADLRSDLARRGALRLATYSRGDYRDRLKEILDEARERIVAA